MMNNKCYALIVFYVPVPLEKTTSHTDVPLEVAPRRDLQLPADANYQ